MCFFHEQHTKILQGKKHVFFKEVAHKSSCSCTCTCILCETRAKNRADLLYLLLYSVVAHKPNDKMTHVNNYKAHQPIKQMCVLYMTYLTKKQTKQIHRSVLEEELTHTRAKKGENPRSEQEKRGGEGGGSLDPRRQDSPLHHPRSVHTRSNPSLCQIPILLISNDLCK